MLPAATANSTKRHYCHAGQFLVLLPQRTQTTLSSVARILLSMAFGRDPLIAKIATPPWEHLPLDFTERMLPENR